MSEDFKLPQPWRPLSEPPEIYTTVEGLFIDADGESQGEVRWNGQQWELYDWRVQGWTNDVADLKGWYKEPRGWK